jgi:soluble lytic murein transglycosylase-like protein
MTPVHRETRGQASILVLGGLAGLLIAAVIAGAVANAVGREAAAQRAADLAAVAAAKVMHANYHRLFEPAYIEEAPNPNHLGKADYLELARTAASEVAAANGAAGKAVTTFPDEDTIAPVRVRVAVGDMIRVGNGEKRRALRLTVDAEAELAPAAPAGFAEGGGYQGPLAYRQGVPMRPDVAPAFDRMEAAARADGVTLTITSGFRSDAEQAVLWARNPDPKWVARPGTSLHRNGTELDLGPPAAYAWLAANASRFHFIKRYSWEPWHFGFALNTGSSLRTGNDGAAPASHGAVPGFVPERFAPILRDAAQRWNVSAKLLAAQLYAESGFNPFAVSRAGAQGIAQFMPGTAAAVGLENPFDAEQAIHAQARLMRDLLRQFGSVPLALAAYNAGPGAVSRCGCLPYAETRGYVARIIGLMTGTGVPIDGTGGGLEVRLVR